MSLTQQFLVISILPMSFLGMAAYLWRPGSLQRRAMWAWTITLVAAALWSSNVLRFYGGVTFSPALVFSWGVLGSYFFTLTAAGILLTTYVQFAVARRQGQAALMLSMLLWFASLALDPAVWSYHLSNVVLAGRNIRHFDVWAAVWIASWLLPIVAAWVLAQQLGRELPRSLYRNQLHYWLLVLALFTAGGVLASIRQPGQPVWQEVAMLFVILAGLAGTAGITHAYLPDLQLVFRLLLGRLSGTLILFALTWGALRFVVARVSDLPAATDPNLILTLAAALFAGAFVIIYRLVNAITRRLFVPSLSRRKVAMDTYANAIGNLPGPAQLVQMALRLIQSTLSVDEAWFFTTEDGPAGKLIFRPLAFLGTEPPGNAQFDGESRFTNHLRRQKTPLAQLDIDALSAFDHMPAEEKRMLSGWHRALYVPLATGDRLVGVFALGARSSGDSFRRGDIERLSSLAAQLSPLFAQAEQLDSLRQINDYLFQQNRDMALKQQHLTELAKLYTQYIKLVSPELRRSFASIDEFMQQVSEAGSSDLPGQKMIDAKRDVDALKARLDRLIALSARLQKRDIFNFKPVRLEEVAAQAVRNLTTMTEARRVHIAFNQDSLLPAVYGDEQQLREAVQHILHNAVKFSKIGGQVEIKASVDDGQVVLYIVDGGVGMPGDRLEKLWEGLAEDVDSDGRDSGYGLALSQFIVAAHGGHIRAQSKYGYGSTFSIHLPMMVEEG